MKLAFKSKIVNLNTRSNYMSESDKITNENIGSMIRELIDNRKRDTIDFWFNNITSINEIYEILQKKFESGENTYPDKETAEINTVFTCDNKCRQMTIGIGEVVECPECGQKYYGLFNSVNRTITPMKYKEIG